MLLGNSVTSEGYNSSNSSNYAEVEAPATQAPSEVVDQAAQTFDFGVVAAIAAVVSLAGYAVAKKH